VETLAEKIKKNEINNIPQRKTIVEHSIFLFLMFIIHLNANGDKEVN
jgi:hypothetical protein